MQTLKDWTVLETSTVPEDATHPFPLNAPLDGAMASTKGQSILEQQRIYSAEQIVVPPALPQIVKEWTKEVIRNNPKDIVGWSTQYFERKKAELAASQ